jgi:hypothetical protein
VVRRSRLRRSLLAAALGVGLGAAQPLWGTTGGLAAENLVFVSGGFRRSIPVADLEHLASTGKAQGLLADLLSFSKQQPSQVAKLLNESISMPVTLVSRLLNTRIGEAVLERLAQIVYPLKAPGVGLPALRSAVVMGLVEGNGSLTAVRFLRAYPNDNMEVSIPALLSLMGKTNSIADLVRFFSEAPLSGLRGEP